MDDTFDYLVAAGVSGRAVALEPLFSEPGEFVVFITQIALALYVCIVVDLEICSRSLPKETHLCSLDSDMVLPNLVNFRLQSCEVDRASGTQVDKLVVLLAFFILPSVCLPVVLQKHALDIVQHFCILYVAIRLKGHPRRIQHVYILEGQAMVMMLA